MTEPLGVEQDEQDPGTTFVLTPQGWEKTEYLEPGDDWVMREDGSFESPDGTTRTWMLADPAGQG